MTPVSPLTFLAQSTLARIGPQVRLPRYDRAGLGVGIVHFGPGAFHRAHQAWFVDELLAQDPRWGISAVSLRNKEVHDALAPQDGLYTLATLDETISYRVIGALREILVAPQSQGVTLQRLSAPTTRVVTITVTEKGYCLDRDGNLDPTHPDIKHDMSQPHTPTSLIGYLVEGLRRRKLAGAGPLSIISCDNLVDNGTRLRSAVSQLARINDLELGRWIQEDQYFPRTMVDSITPATTPALKERVAGVLALADRWPVQRESFVQWVLEDRIAPGGPDWASVGVTLTDDVAAYDRAKLRLLNGAHSTLAYLGLLAGHVTVADAMQDDELRSFVETLMREDILPTLRAPRGLDLHSYIDTILRRFRNPAINHLLAQIAWDGSQKLPFRLMGTLLDNLAAGRPVERLCVPIAAWMHFVRRRAREGVRVTDPLAERLFDIGRAAENRADRDLGPFLALDTVFPVALAQAPVFTQALAREYDKLAHRPRFHKGD
jgi:fructuronate reductase